MNKSEIIKYLDERIQYFTGGEEMKSMAESCTDEHIVKELKAVRSFIIGDKSKRYVGVICWTIEDFLNWKKEQGFDKLNPSHVAKKFSIGDTFYVCLTKPEHACGYAFDNVIQTNNARHNKNINTIIDYCMVGLKAGGTVNI